MKMKLYTIPAVLMMLLHTSCDNYLKESSGDLLIPQNVEEFTALLFGEGYPHNFISSTGFINLMTDDVEMGRTGNWINEDPIYHQITKEYKTDDALYPYRWAESIEQRIVDNAWATAYEGILGCNLIIEALPTMNYSESQVGDYNALAACAYTLRAYHNFCLLNWYALPYSQENLSKPGIIIKTSPEVTIDPQQRASIEESYAHVNNDIALARKHAESATFSKNKMVMNGKALEVIANRIALFQKKYDEVIRYGEVFLKENGTLLSLKSQDQTKFGLNASPFTMLNSTNPEIVFSFSRETSPYPYINENALFTLGYKANSTSPSPLITLYAENDLRLKAYYKVDTGTSVYQHFPLKYYSRNQNSMYVVNWRNVEVMLNVAEAYVRETNSISTEAIDLINTIRKSRYDDTFTPLTAADFADSQALLKLVLEERRKELAFEETMRFWDLRRLGMPEIEHRFYSDFTTYETYILPAGSPNYTLQIPSSETGNNNLITTNERVNIQAQ